MTWPTVGRMSTTNDWWSYEERLLEFGFRGCEPSLMWMGRMTKTDVLAQVLDCQWWSQAMENDDWTNPKDMEPQNWKKLRSFSFGMINFYCTDICSKIGQKLWPPMISMTKIPKLSFQETLGSLFDQTKAIVTQNVLVSHPDPNQEFEIVADASKSQLDMWFKH